MRDTSRITSTSKIPRHSWEESSSEYADDRDNDHKFDEGKTTSGKFHKKEIM
jgi:hypothetical protein